MQLEWPSDVLADILRSLALDGDDRTFQRLAFLTHNSADLAKKARAILRPLVVDISLDHISKHHLFRLPFSSATIVDIEISWGDGNVETLTKKGDGYAQHRYERPGEYRVRVFPGPAASQAAHNEDASNIKALDHLGFEAGDDKTWIWWSPIRNFVSLGKLGIDSLAYVFNNSNFNKPLSHLNVAGVRDMSCMFSYATVFNQPIGNWDVSKVVDMSCMFLEAIEFNQPIGRWNVSSAVDMRAMSKGLHLSTSRLASGMLLTSYARLKCSLEQHHSNSRLQGGILAR
jgi:surface protein